MPALRAQSPEETADIGRRLGRLLKPGDTVLLTGDLGAGKTVFAKGIASALGIAEREVASASFTIIAEYDSTPPLYHIDLYRIERESDLEAVGLYEYIGADGIAVIEWAERLHGYAPERAVHVTISFTGAESEGREITIKGTDEARWDNL